MIIREYWDSPEPDYDEDGEYVDITEYIDFSRDNIIVYIGENGTIDTYADSDLDFAKNPNDSSGEYGADVNYSSVSDTVMLADKYSIIEDFESLIYGRPEYDKLIPRKKGKYSMSFTAELAYLISNIYVKTEHTQEYAGRFGNEIEYTDDYWDEYYLDSAQSEFDIDKSTITNLKFRHI